MPLSVRERVIAALVARLGTVAPPNVPGPLTVYRARRLPVPEGKLPALNVLVAGGAAAEQLSAAVTRTILRVSVEGLVKAADDAGTDRQLADLAASIQAAIEADPTLGGLAVDTRAAADDQDTVETQGQGAIGAVLAGYEIEFWTRAGDPYAAAP